MIAAHRYYSDSGVRQICHLAKQGCSSAVNMMALELSLLINDDNALLVPIPSHYGYSTYTLEIVKRSGLPYADILRCQPHESVYSMKKSGVTDIRLKMFASNIPEGKNIYLVDNVYGTGATARAAMDALGVECEVVVYAYDETKNNLKAKS